MKKISVPLTILLFFYLLLCPETALHSAREGLLLWYNSILPSLFPFMLLCSLALKLDLLDSVIGRFYKPFHVLTGCSPYGAFAIFTGFLCGFPMGAKITHELKEQNKITAAEAAWLIGFVNNLSPVFLVTFLAFDQLKVPSMKYLFLFNILGASFLYGILTSLSFRRKKKSYHVNKSTETPDSKENIFERIDACIFDAARSILRLGVYIMMFAIIRDGLAMVLPSGTAFSSVLLASIEVTNGIRDLAASPLPFPQKYLLANALCAFGGFCALAQSAALGAMDRKTLLQYIKSRVFATLLSILLASCSLLFSIFL